MAAALVMLAAWLQVAGAADVVIPMGSFQLNPFQGRRLTITPTNFPSVSGNILVLEDYGKFTTDSSGQVIVTNMVAGSYVGEIVGTNKTSYFTFTVPNTNATLQVVDLLSSGTNDPGVGVAFSQVSSDRRYALRTNGNAHALKLTSSNAAPAVGKVWTSTGTDGSGAWSNSVGGSSGAYYGPFTNLVNKAGLTNLGKYVASFANDSAVSGSSASDLDTTTNAHLVLENTTGDQTKVVFTFGGAPLAGVRVDLSGNMNWHCSPAGYHQFWNSLDGSVGAVVMRSGQMGVGTVPGSPPNDTLEVANGSLLLNAIGGTPATFPGGVKFYGRDAGGTTHGYLLLDDGTEIDLSSAPTTFTAITVTNSITGTIPSGGGTFSMIFGDGIITRNWVDWSSSTPDSVTLFNNLGTAVMKKITLADTGLTPVAGGVVGLGTSGAKFSDVWATNVFGNNVQAALAQGTNASVALTNLANTKLAATNGLANGMTNLGTLTMGTNGASTIAQVGTNGLRLTSGTNILELQTNGLTTGGAMAIGGQLVASGGAQVAAGTSFNTASRGIMKFNADGVLALQNAAGNGFTRLQFGVTTSSGPGLIPNGAGLIVGGADGTFNSSNHFTVPGSLMVTNNQTNQAKMYVQGSTLQARVGGAVFVQTSSVTNNGASDTVLWTNTIPANTLSSDGDELVMHLNFRTTATCLLSVYFGGTVVSSISISPGGASQYCEEVRIMRTGATTQRTSTLGSHSENTGQADYRTAAKDLTTALGLAVRSSSTTTTGDCALQMGKVEFSPSP